MGILYSAYDILKQENNDESVKLKRDHRLVIERVISYISSKRVSLFELELIKKDMLGLAMEAESEGISLKNKLGVSEKQFAESISLETEGESMHEQILLFFRKMMLCVCGAYFLFFLLSGAPKEYGITLDVVFYGVIIVFLHDYLDKIVENRFIYSENSKKIRRYISIVEFIGIIIWFQIPFDFILIPGNGWIVGMILFVLALVVHIVNHIYWNKQSEKYNWK